MKITDLIYNPFAEDVDAEYIPHTTSFMDALAAAFLAKEVQGIVLPCGCVHNGTLLLADITTYCQVGHYIG
ncbi:MAG: hypothetical protein U1D67_04270 [Dehalococcoidia bacterium]|nr:hypothetical protein [Dehalococcoidia bacterium]